MGTAGFCRILTAANQTLCENDVWGCTHFRCTLPRSFENIAQLIRPAVPYVILLHVCGQFLSPRARYVILLGHAQDTENDILQKLTRIWDGSAKQYAMFMKSIPSQLFQYMLSFSASTVVCVDASGAPLTTRTWHIKESCLP